MHNYLASLPVVNAAWGLRVAYLTSLQELTILDSGQQGLQRRILIQTEPAFIGMGPGHVAVGMNNKAGIFPVEMCWAVWLSGGETSWSSYAKAANLWCQAQHWAEGAVAHSPLMHLAQFGAEPRVPV